MYCDTTTERDLVEAVDALRVGPGEAAGVFVAQNTGCDLDDLVEQLRALDVDFFGGIFPGVIAGGRLYRHGAVVLKFPVLSKPRLYRDIHTTRTALEVPALPTGRRPTVFTIIDGLSPGITPFLECVYGHFGSTARYFGAGAGVYLGESAGPFSFARSRCVFTAEGVARDAGVICVADLLADLGVRHGWRHVAGPFIATRTEGNLIVELDWKNAFEVYKTIVEEDSGQILSRQSFFDLARTYPFGLIKEGGDDIVRVVISVTTDDQLLCGAEVVENTTVDILKGTPATLLAAAGFAANESLYRDGAPQAVVVVDCVSRWLVMGDVFDKELALIQSRVEARATGKEAFGVLSLGEIASSGDRLLEYLNKTVAVGALHD